jgi:GMP synthase (glutamine-hydrolysing)
MILVVDMNWKRKSLGFYEFVSPIVKVVETEDNCTVKHFLDVNSQDLSKCDRVILSGTALMDSATLSQPEKFEWLKDMEKPVLGICAGMETIGIVFGMRLIRCLEVGMTSIRIVRDNPFYTEAFKAFSLHSYCVEPTFDFDVFAESSKCSQIIRHKIKPVYGVLFHPEVRNTELIKSFLQL